MRTEDQEQRVVVEWLDWKRHAFCHVPNGGKRSKIEAAIFKGLGVKAGVPDLLIFSRTEPMLDRGYVGVAIEMKSEKGKLSPLQKEWLGKLSKCGWLAVCCYGADEAITMLEKWGY